MERGTKMPKGKIVVTISNISETQANRFASLFGWMNACGALGCSREARIFYDGDGGARAIIEVNGENPTYPVGTDDTSFDFE